MATCTEIRNQLAALLTSRAQLGNEVESDKGDLRELESESKHVNPTILAEARAKLAADVAKLRQLDDQFAALRGALEEQHCLRQPQQILEIQFANPQDVKDVDSLYAQAVAFGQPNPSAILGGKFPSPDAQQEWKQVLPKELTNTAAHNEDYEGRNLVGAIGWALKPEFSGADVPFNHPFGFDWEFMLALDQPVVDPKRYTFLLAPADQSCDEPGFEEAVQQAGDFKDLHGQPIIPLGPDGLPSLLGVEMDSGLIPRQFSDWRQGGVDQGDRIAVFGRWIVDCGHQVAITRCDGKDLHKGVMAFRTEIHPPLLMAAARVTSGSLLEPPVALSAPEFTRVLFTSRPYLVSQRITTDTGNIYDDAQPDDGPFFPHMISEVVKAHETLLGIPTASVQVEAHPKIKSSPFQGFYELHFIVRPPPQNQGAGGAAAHGPLAVAFQFTVRSGCTVQVTSGAEDTINIVIKLSQDVYMPPPLPTRKEHTWSREELGTLNKDAANGYISAELWSAAIHVLIPELGGALGAAVATGILEQGIKTDEYDTSGLTSVNILDASHAVSALANNIPTDNQALLQQERNQLAREVESDKSDLKELERDAKHVNPTILAKARARLADDAAKLKQIDDQIAALKDAAGHGVLQKDDQPYPVYGWLEVGYTKLIFA